MSKSNIVRGPHCSRKTCEKGEERDREGNTSVPLMHFFDKRRK